MPGVSAGIQNGFWLEIWICAVPVSSRCRLQMTAIANRYLISRQRERRTRGMCNQKGRRTLGEARMPTAPSLAWAVPGAVIKVK